MKENQKISEKVSLAISIVLIFTIATFILIIINADWAAYSNKTNEGSIWYYLFWYLPLLILLFIQTGKLQEINKLEVKENELRKWGNSLGTTIVYLGLLLFNSFFIIFVTETAHIIVWLGYLEKLNFALSIYLLFKCQKKAGGTM